jgi:putative transposase
MRDISRFFYHLVACIIKMLRPGGVKSIAAENLILRQQLIVIKRTRRRAPRLNQADRTLFAILAQIIPQNRLRKLAIILKPATILKFHRALVKRKYRLLYSAKRPRSKRFTNRGVLHSASAGFFSKPTHDRRLSMSSTVSA